MNNQSPPAKKPRIALDNMNHKQNSNCGELSNGMEIDENLYSRQLYVMGTEGMKNMAKSNVLISGLGGLGLEIAKNIILAGVRSVVLQDDEDVKNWDLSSQYYFNKSDIGKNRAEVSYSRLSELNTYVTVSFIKKPLDSLKGEKFDVAVLTNSTYQEIFNFNKYCRSNNIKLIVANTGGLFGQIFCDFGENHVIFDLNGEEVLSVFIENISHDENGVVKCLDNSRHGFETGDSVVFDEVKGMVEINKTVPRIIEVIDATSFKIGDTRMYSSYLSSGTCTQVKIPKTQSFKTFEEAYKNPNFIDSDFAKPERAAQLHIFYRAANEIISKGLKLKENFELLESLTKELNKEFFPNLEIDVRLMKLFSKAFDGNLSPIQSIIGGIAGQEVLKACSGKFNPIHQFFYFDALECLSASNENDDTSTHDTGDLNSISHQIDDRHKSQISIFGESFQNKLANMNVFIVGAGAIGCELLKNFAMIGIGENKGNIYITDMDTIERSNLNRQFLFRNKDIGKMKSHAASASAKLMNSLINVKSFDLKVCQETEIYFNDSFFNNIDVVANALDNIDARMYMDRRCVFYEKPLLESGTLGTKGNVQVVIPHLTESYSSSHDPPEKTIPVCTLKNFPYQIEHTIQWARDLFEGLFVTPSLAAFEYINNQKKFIDNTNNEMLQIVYKLLSEKPCSFKDCIIWARNLWNKYFVEHIAQLLHNFPPNATNNEGAPFWYGTKRCPVTLKFNLEEEYNYNFVYSTACIYAAVFGIDISPYYTKNNIMQDLECYTPPTFELKKVKIATAENDVETNEIEESSVLKSVDYLTNLDISGIKINCVEFEKDVDESHHIDFITAASNLRAKNYGIEPASRLKTKKIAGKIIPAIATTTGLVAGLVTLELYKIAQGHKKLDLYKNGFVNLALPFFGFSEPIPPNHFGFENYKWSQWDKIELQHPMTLCEFINYFKEKYDLTVSIISQDVTMIYAFFQSSKIIEAHMNLSMTEILEKQSKKKIPEHCNSLIFEVSFLTDVEVPYVKYNIR